MKYGILSSNYTFGNPVTDADVISGFVAPLSIISNQPAYAQDSANLKRRASSQLVQRWEIQASLDPTNNSAVNLIHSTVHGVNNPFYIRMPQVYGLGIAEAVKPKLRTPALRGAASIDIDKALLEGEFINIGTFTKVYLVTEVTKINAEVPYYTVKIKPSLVNDVSGASDIAHGGNTVMHAYYDTDTQIGITYVDGVLSDQGSLKFIERLA